MIFPQIWTSPKKGKTVYYLYNEKGQRIYKRVVENGTNTDTQYVYNGDLLVTQLNPNKATDRLDFAYDENGQLYGFVAGGQTKYFYVKDSLGTILGIVNDSGTLVVKYSYDAFGTCTIPYDAGGIGYNNPFRWKCYYYDRESGMYYCQGRYYVPEWCRWLNAGDVSNLDEENPNGLNLFAYCANNPVSKYIASASEQTDGYETSGDRPYLMPVPWLVSHATTIYGTASAVRFGVPILSHYIKHAKTINDEFRLYGISKWKTSLQLSNVSFKLTRFDGVMVGLDVLIDMYDSYQRGVSTEGILLGGALTAVAGIGLLYLNKGIMWTTTTIGTAICPGLGTSIGFGVGLILSIVIDWKLGELISDWIDSISK